MSFSSLSVLTWNIWFERFEIQSRYDHILDTIESLRPDVICFQEVIPIFLSKLQNRHRILQEYEPSDPDLEGTTICVYGVLTLVKKKWRPTFNFYEFPTRMSRKLLLASLHTEENNQNSSFCVGNVHLESLNSHSVREAQLKICAEAFKDFANYVLVGDYNFCSYRNYSGEGELENNSLHRILPDIVDLWPALHDVASDPGITFYGGFNPLVTNPNERMRYDRICAHLCTNDSNEASWKADQIEMIGNAPIPVKDTPTVFTCLYSTPPKTKVLKAPLGRNIVDVFPSDHFGLLAKFSR